MPRRNDIKKILLIGSGPIIIGQACEFDYSGTQACKALREEGYVVVLVNSNPATIMTDPEMADRTYIEPLTWEIVAKVIEAERPDALLPTLGGQTGLNLAMDLHRHGVLEKYGVEMIGANAAVIEKAESRDQFKAAMERIGLEVPRGQTVGSLREARQTVLEIGLPCVVRPSFTLGGTGSSIAYNREEFDGLVQRGLDLSPIHQVLLEESVIGWKEFEMEVMRDKDDNCVIICSIENFDPMGVHTGDSITVAPAQTLTDKEYQRMRDASIAVMREIGVETGGSNIQFAVDPKTGRMVVIEMNPRVSRSSALASKATGFPIAKIAAKLAVGYRLHELPNDITRETMACFEPTIDYVVTKVPRFAFEKFPEADPRLTTQMKSVGETMAIGRTFKESFQKALRGLEVGSFGFGCDGKDLWGTPEQPSIEEVRSCLATPCEQRVWCLRYAIKYGMTLDEIYEITGIDPWFLENLQEIVEMENHLRGLGSIDQCDDATLRRAKRFGFSDRQLATIWSMTGDGRPPGAQAAGDRAGVQVGRYVRRGVRGLHALLLFDLRGRGRDAAKAAGPQAGDDSRRRPEPHRPRHRVRLLLLPRQLRPARTGHRVDHGQLEPGNGLDRLRHLRSAVLRAADDRGRAEHLRPHRARRRDRAVRRADAAEPRPGAEQRRRADHRHQRRHDRGRRGPREVQEHSAPAGAEAAGQRHRAQHGAGPQPGGPGGISRAGAAELRARRPGDGNLLRRRAVRAIRGRGVPGFAGAAGLDRPLPRRRHRGGRRRHRRRPAGDRRRHHGAHRGGGRAFGRFGLRHSAVQSAAGGGRGNPPGHLRVGPAAEGQGADEHPVRRETRGGASRTSTCSRSTRGQAARCRSCRRRSACRWPRWRPR